MVFKSKIVPRMDHCEQMLLTLLYIHWTNKQTLVLCMGTINGMVSREEMKIKIKCDHVYGECE